MYTGQTVDIDGCSQIVDGDRTVDTSAEVFEVREPNR